MKAVALLRRRSGVPVPLAVAGAGALSLLVFGWSILGLLALVLGLGAALALKLAQVAQAGARNAQQATDPIRDLRQRLFRSQYAPGVGEMGEQAVSQLDSVERRFREFQKLLGEKLQPTELTYDRFLGAAEGVRSAMLSRLEEIATELASLGGEDAAPFRERLRQAQGDERAALEARLQARDSRLARAKDLLTDNERALTELDRATAAVGEMSTGSGASRSDFDSALRELEEIARRASRFQ